MREPTWGGVVARITEDMRSAELDLTLDRSYDGSMSSMPLPRAGDIYYLLTEAEFFRLTGRNDPR